MSCHYTTQDGFSFFTDKNDKPDFIVYKYGAVSDNGTPIETYIKKHAFKKFIINIENNTQIPKIVDSLLNFPELEALNCHFEKEKYDTEIFNKLPNLKHLNCNLENITLRAPKLETLRADFGKNAVISTDCKSLKNVYILRCKDYNAFWEQIQKLPAVENIELSFGTLPDFSSFRSLPNLKKLTLVYLKKLSDISNIAVLAKTLKSLWFEEGAGKRITDWTPLSSLSALEELVIANNSVISDLHFLDSLKNLKSLRLVSVKITAEDLSPLKSIPQVLFYSTGIDRKLKTYLSERE